MANIKGYKVFNPDWTCRGFKYEVGKTYETKEDLSICQSGFHFCKQAAACFNYYCFDPSNKVAEVIALGEVIEEEDKCCTNKLQIVRELSWIEVLTLVNTGMACTGLGNSGDFNSGNQNSGDYNSGDSNSGHYNNGHMNSGDYNNGNWNSSDFNNGDFNSGNYNSGSRNSGDYNSGNHNTGNYNSGRHNSGDYNSGNQNSGDCNSGDYNSGNYNSGNSNSGDYNTASNVAGCFNTENQKIRFFDKETDMTLEQWRDSKAYSLLQKIGCAPTDWTRQFYMSAAEIAKHPECKTMGGYLKINNNPDCCQDRWDALTQEEQSEIKNIPNFDADKFFTITGIRV